MSDRIEKKEKKLNIVCYENAYAIPGKQNIVHIYDQNGDYVPYTYKRRYNKTEYAIPQLKLLPEEKNVEFVEEEVVYLGFMRGHWGHFMVDSSIRLWAIEEPECKGKRMIVTIEGMEKFYEKLFCILGIEKEKLLLINKPLQFRKIFVPDLAYLPGNYISNEYLTPFNKVKEMIELNSPQYSNLYFSRRHFSRGKKEFGEQKIQNIFERNGYKVIYPEELSFEEQVWLLKNCKSLVTTNGTIAHNILYAADETELIVLKRFEETENIHQKVINEIKKINVVYIDAYIEGSRHDNSMMCLTEDLKNFLTERKMEYHWYDHPILAKKSMYKLYLLVRKYIDTKRRG